MNRIKTDHQPQTIIDIGCGPGNSSKTLADRWPDARLVGIDSSQSMIDQAKRDYPQHEWTLADAATFSTDTKFDIVFSNAAIQWIPDHVRLLTRFCALLSEQGILAIQVPQFRDMPLGKAIEKVAQKERWQRQTAHCKGLFTYHSYGFYYDQLAKQLDLIELWETHYHHVLASQSAIIDFIKSTGMKPYLESLDSDSERAEFEREVLTEVEKDYPLQEDGKVLFPFKRLFFIGYKRR